MQQISSLILEQKLGLKQMTNQEEYTILIVKSFKTIMLKSSFCDYSNAYILVTLNITVINITAANANGNNTSKKVIFKYCAPFSNCISEINNTQLNKAKDIDIVMPMYNLIEYSHDYSKASGSICQSCKDIPGVNNNGNIVKFNGTNAADLFNFEAKVTGKTDSFNFEAKATDRTRDDGKIEGIEIMVPKNT